MQQREKAKGRGKGKGKGNDKDKGRGKGKERGTEEGEQRFGGGSCGSCVGSEAGRGPEGEGNVQGFRV